MLLLNTKHLFFHNLDVATLPGGAILYEIYAAVQGGKVNVVIVSVALFQSRHRCMDP